jgi:TIGR03009 family protein
MRHLGPTLAALLLAVSTLPAQTNPAPPPPKTDRVPLPDPQLDAMLKAWERKMTSIERLSVGCSLVEKDGLRGKEQVFKGSAKFLKPNMAILDLANDERPKEDKLFYVSNGNKLYEYQYKNKVVRVHELPKGGGISDDTFLAFLFGMKAEDARKRYTLRAEEKPDAKYHVYLTVLPKTPADKQEFTVAQLVFYHPDIGTVQRQYADWALLPARLWFKSPNGDEATWTFSEPNLNPKLEKSNFVPSSPPKDWRVENADATPAADRKRPQSNYTIPNPDVPPTKVRQ